MPKQKRTLSSNSKKIRRVTASIKDLKRIGICNKIFHPLAFVAVGVVEGELQCLSRGMRVAAWK